MNTPSRVTSAFCPTSSVKSLKGIAKTGGSLGGSTTRLKLVTAVKPAMSVAVIVTVALPSATPVTDKLAPVTASVATLVFEDTAS